MDSSDEQSVNSEGMCQARHRRHRVNGPTEEDVKGLTHLLWYSKGPLHYKMALRPSMALPVEFGQLIF